MILGGICIVKRPGTAELGGTLSGSLILTGWRGTAWRGVAWCDAVWGGVCGGLGGR